MREWPSYYLPLAGLTALITFLPTVAAVPTGQAMFPVFFAWIGIVYVSAGLLDHSLSSAFSGMGEPFEQISELDRLIHEPARLAILTALSACRSAEFLYLQRLTGLTKGNLSSHLSRLEEAGLIAVEKGFVARTPRTRVEFTGIGRDRIETHWQRLEDIRRDVKAWGPALRPTRVAPYRAP